MTHADPWRTTLSLVILVFGLPVGAAADEGRRVMRHEYVPRSFLEQLAGVGPAVRFEPGEPIPRALRRDGERLAAPEGPPRDAPSFGAPVGSTPEGGATSGAGSPGGDEIYRTPTELRPDRKTQSDDPLTYHAVFNPSVAPFRRDLVYNAVGADDRLYISSGRNMAVPIGPRVAEPGREVFWADLTVTLEGGAPVPIPSVAPDMRVLAARATPPVDLSFHKDPADNLYVRADATGRVRLTLLVDADAAYFSAPLPPNVPLNAQREALGTELPTAARRAGERVLAELGIAPDAPLDQGVARLVEHFRGFTAGTPPPTKGHVAEDLALGRRGVCRHRAYAFMVVARAAWVPTRFVRNEAHAFVEIRGPDGRWRRVDLGGESPSLDLRSGDGQRLHAPPPDPYPQPPAYQRQYSGLATEGDGGAPSSGSPAGESPVGEPPAGGSGGGGGSAGGGTPSGNLPGETEVRGLPPRIGETPSPGKPSGQPPGGVEGEVEAPEGGDAEEDEGAPRPPRLTTAPSTPMELGEGTWDLPEAGAPPLGGPSDGARTPDAAGVGAAPTWFGPKWLAPPGAQVAGAPGAGAPGAGAPGAGAPGADDPSAPTPGIGPEPGAAARAMAATPPLGPVQVPLPVAGTPGSATAPAPGPAARRVGVLTLRGVPEAMQAHRGQALPLPLRGALRDADGGSPLAGVAVQTFLVPETAGDPIPVGPQVLTGANGDFSVPVRLPATLPLGPYRLVVASQETPTHAAARSDDDEPPAE